MNKYENEVTYAYDRLCSVRRNLVLNKDFFGYILMHIEFVPDPLCETAATNAKYISYNPSFVLNLTDTEIEFLIIHELCHILLMHPIRAKGKDVTIYNIACDAVVNSLILEKKDKKFITINNNVSIHKTPDGQEGRLFSAEKAYEMFMEHKEYYRELYKSSRYSDVFIDNHHHWCDELDEATYVQISKWIHDAILHSNSDTLPKRLLHMAKSNYINWKDALAEFCHFESIYDYKWLHPDKRYSEKDVILPSFCKSDNDVSPDELLFFVDCSGSVNTENIERALGEICNIFESSTNAKATLAFFNDKVIEPVYTITSETDIKSIKFSYDGDTSFFAIFEYIKKNYSESQPTAIVIMTDGYAEFPPEELALGIPTLWIISGSEVIPPWGKWLSM